MLLAGFAAATLVAGCSQQASAPAKPVPTAAPPAQATAPAQSAAAPSSGGAEGGASAPQAAQINDAKFSPQAEPAPAPKSAGTAKSAPAPDPMLVKAEVLLARADFSPGEVDGLTGSNFRHAVAAYAQANGLQSDGDLT